MQPLKGTTDLEEMKWGQHLVQAPNQTEEFPKGFPVSTPDPHTVLSPRPPWHQGELNVPSYVLHVIDPAETHMKSITSPTPQHTYIILKYINFIKTAILASRYVTPINLDRYNMFSSILLFIRNLAL